jgi:PKD repeat protein
MAGSNVNFHWDFGNGMSGEGALASHAYAAPGIYTAMLTANNSAGVLTTTLTVQVEQAINGLILDSSASTISLGQAVIFTASVEAGSAVSYTWDFGDGTTGIGINVTHTYLAAGDYTIRVTAFNPVSSQSVTKVIIVRALDGQTRIYLPLIVNTATGKTQEQTILIDGAE